MTKKNLTTAYGAIKWGCLVVVVGLAGFLTTTGVFAQAPFEDSFDTYNLGELHGQGGWVSNDPPRYINVVDVGCYSGKCIESASTTAQTNFKDGAQVVVGSISFAMKLGSFPRVAQTGFRVVGAIGETVSVQIMAAGAGIDKVIFYTYGSAIQVLIAAPVAGQWYMIHCEWDLASAVPAEKVVRCKYDDNEWSSWYRQRHANNNVYRVWFNVGEAGDALDEIYATPVPPELRVWGVSPASGSTITDLKDDFTFGWEGWDFEWVYNEFSLSFTNKRTGIMSSSVRFEPPTKSGTHTLKFEDFEIYENADWHFWARAISGYPWYYMTTDLVDPEYYVKIEIEDFPVLFEMPDWEMWYDENVDRFATSTAIFSGIVGFLSPIYGQIGAFGEGIAEFLDTDEAYQTGYSLGSVIPVFRHYVNEIEFLFGGFPIITIFLALLVLLLGLFVVKLILKFIPFLG